MSTSASLSLTFFMVFLPLEWFFPQRLDWAYFSDVVKSPVFGKLLESIAVGHYHLWYVSVYYVLQIWILKDV